MYSNSIRMCESITPYEQAHAIVQHPQTWRAAPPDYVSASIVQTARMPGLTLDVEIDGTPLKVRLTNLMINNTRHTGNFYAFRNASLLDGRCELLIAENRLWQQILQNLAVLSHISMYRRGHEFRARTVRLRSATPYRLMLDGEIWEEVRELHACVLPQRLCCYCWSMG